MNKTTLQDIREATLALRKMKDEFQEQCEHDWVESKNPYSSHHSRQIVQCRVCKSKGMTNFGILESVWGSYGGQSYIQFSEE